MSKTANAGSVYIQTNVPGKRLGIKKFGGEMVINGNIIVKQRGTVFHAGKNTKVARDHSIYAVADGQVTFRRMSGSKRGQYYIDVLPVEETAKANK